MPEIRNGETVFFRRKLVLHFRRLPRVYCPIAPANGRDVSDEETCAACKLVQEVTDRGVYCRKIMPRFQKACEKICPKR